MSFVLKKRRENLKTIKFQTESLFYLAGKSKTVCFFLKKGWGILIPQLDGCLFIINDFRF